MRQRERLFLAGTLLLAGLGLVGVTSAWFVTMRQTPAGVVNAALVRCLPERNVERDVDSLLTYGGLISGSSVDAEGVPLVLPDDSLLSTQAINKDGKRVVRTSLARHVRAGESEGSVIYGDGRTAADGAAVSMTRRDLMATEHSKLWYANAEGTGAGSEAPPADFNAADYTAVTTARTVVTGGDDQPQSVTTVILKTVYTPREEGKTAYAYIQTTVETVTHEAAKYTDGDGAAITKADFDALVPVFTRTTEETVLWVDPEKDLTRSYLLITETPAAAGTPTEAAPIPLRLENRSTAQTNIRLGITATIQRDGTVTPLELRAGTGTGAGEAGCYYLGQETGGLFVELFRFKPSVGTGYAWAHNTTESTAGDTWTLFDLTLTADGTTTADIPRVPEPAEGAAPEAVIYSVLDELKVAAASSFTTDEAAFEDRFNALYCAGAPEIALSVHYYAKQSEYMEWAEFYSDSLRFTVPGA